LIQASDAKQSYQKARRNIHIYHALGERVMLHDILAGRSAFLLCAGPSLTQHDLSLLDQRGIVTMGLNNVPAVHRTNLWCCGDVPNRFIEQIWKDPTCMKFCPHGHRNKRIRTRVDGNLVDSSFSPYQLPNVWFYNRDKVFVPEEWLTASDFPWGSPDNVPDSLGVKGLRSTLFVALKLLWYLGAGTVYLLGVDFQMENGSAANYAFPQDRSEAAVNCNLRLYETMNVRLQALQPYFQQAGFKVYNCTPDSGLRAFPSMDYSSAVAQAAKECNEKSIQTEGMYE